MTRKFLNLEALEDRFAPAVLFDGSTLFITGSNANDVVSITENHGTDQLRVVDNGVQHVFDGEDVERISVSLYNGNNSFNYSLTGKAGFLNEKEFNIYTGNGFDYLTLDFRGVNSFAVQDDIDIYFSTGDLSDQVAVYLPTIDDATVLAQGNLGGGNDGFTLLQTGDLIDDAELTVNLAGAAGNDNMFVYASYDVDIDSDARLRISMDGGTGADWVESNYRGQMDGELDIDLRGGDNNDFVRSTATFDQGSTGDAWLDVYGDAGVDTLLNNAFHQPSSYVQVLSQISQQ